MDECPLDPGGYFIVNGTEKVILVQEQLSKNRVIVEADSRKELISASVTSSTHERKSKTYVVLKKDLLFMRHNILTEDIPMAILLKAMGVTSDMEMMAIVAGTDRPLQEDFAINFEESIRLGVNTQQQALEYLGARIKITRRATGFGTPRRNYVQEALEAVSGVQLPPQGFVLCSYGQASVDGQAGLLTGR
jgi:DNA-directed RNA polymerase III subunit RPC2